jgi:hypothetical protein
MNQTEIASKNLMIHQYMCDTEEERKELEKSLNHAGFLDTLHYHDDPIWLFQVVERILSRETVTLSMNTHGALFGGMFPTAHSAGGSIMENLFNAVHELIVLLNTKKT